MTLLKFVSKLINKYGVEDTKPINPKPNLVSTTTTTIINRKRISKIVDSSYPCLSHLKSNSGSDSDDNYALNKLPMIRSSNPSAESFCNTCIEDKAKKVGINYCKCCGKQLLRAKARSSYAKARASKKGRYTNRIEHHSEEELLAEAKIAYYKRRKRCSYLNENSLKKDKLKKRIGKLSTSISKKKSKPQFVTCSQEQPCCLINGKPLKGAGVMNADFFSFNTYSNKDLIKDEYKRYEQEQQYNQKVHLKKSKAMSNIKQHGYLAYFSNKKMKSRMSSTLTNNETSLIISFCKLKKEPIVARRCLKYIEPVEDKNQQLVKCRNETRDEDELDGVDVRHKLKQLKQLQKNCSTFLVDFASTPIKIAPKTSTPIKKLCNNVFD